MDIQRLYRYSPDLSFRESVAAQPTLDVNRHPADTEISLNLYSLASHWATAIFTPQQALELGNQLIELANQVLEPDTFQLDEKLAFSPPLDKEG